MGLGAAAGFRQALVIALTVAFGLTLFFIIFAVGSLTEACEE